MIELDLMTAAQHEQVPEDEEITAADRLIVESPSTTGLIAIRAMAPEPGLMPAAQAPLPARDASARRPPRRRRACACAPDRARAAACKGTVDANADLSVRPRRKRGPRQ